MKLILKNLRQAEFEIDVESNLITVKELKLKIENEYSYDSDQIKLIYKGSILDDSKSLIQYNINENCQIIMMSTVKKQMENKPLTNNNNNNININNNINKPIEQNKQNEEKTEKNEEITDILKSNLNITINSLVDMGYEKPQAEIAVKAANGRIDLAIEYLNNGIPDNTKNNNSRNNNNNTRNNNKNEIMNELKKQASIIKVLCKNDKNYIFYLLDNIKRNDPGLLRLITDYRNEFKNLLDEPVTEEDERIYKNIETKADEIILKKFDKTLKELGDKLKEENEKKEKEKKENEKKEEEIKDKEEKEKIGDNKKDNIEKEKEKEENKNDDKKEEKNEKSEDKKEEVENNEEKQPEENKENTQFKNNEPKENSEDIKNEIAKENEQKNDKIENNEENNNKENENKNLDNNDNQNENQLTDQDKEVIARLQNLGDFSYEKVYEAYIVCNKNEELTANYLFEAYN